MEINERIAKDADYMKETGNCPVLKCNQRMGCSKLENRDFEYCGIYIEYAQTQLNQSFSERLEDLAIEKNK